MTNPQKSPSMSRGLRIACLSLLAWPAARAQSTRVDWPTFLARHDLVWDHSLAGWGRSAFVGNGLVGAWIDVDGGALGWTINRTDVSHDAQRYPIGRVVLQTAGRVTGGSARLTLWDAEASGVAVTERGEVRWRTYVPRRPSVVVVEIEGRGGEAGVDLAWAPAVARPPRKVARREAFAPEDLHPDPLVTDAATGITSVQPFVGGDAHAESIRRGPVTNGRRTFYVAIGWAPGDSTRGAAALRDARAATDSALRLGPASLAAAHRAWWHAYYPASFLSFPDARLESYYWIQIYKLAAAMRPDGPILDLNGPWYRSTPWPAIWWNLNIQLTYSPLFRANRVDLSESLFRNLDRGRAALEANVPARLRGQAAAIGRSSGPDLARSVNLGAAQSDAAHEMGNLPWTMFYYWQRYRYTMDERVLRDRLYPLLRLAIGNYLGHVERGDDGRWHLPKTHSPELATVPDANYDLALLRWGLETMIASAGQLRIDDPLLPRWRDVLANLTPFPTDSAGLMVGRDRPWRESHRHYSHLLAIYPLGLLEPDRADDRALIETSLRTWERDLSAFRGYSFTGGAAMHAWLSHGDEALDRLTRYLDAPRYMEPNTFYAEAGPVIETPFSAAASIQELFLQDWGGALRVFPAVPGAWRDAAFQRLRADGAFLVSAVRRNGRTAWVRVESLAGQPCRIAVPDWTGFAVRARGGAARVTAGRRPGEFACDLPKGAWVVLAPDATSPLPDLAPVPRPPGRNPWPALAPDTTRREPGPQDGPDMVVGPIPQREVGPNRAPGQNEGW